MDQSVYVHLIFSDPAASLKSVLRLVHFIGLACGLGAATLADFLVLKFFVRRRISHEGWEIFHFATRIVNLGLVLLWITGIGFFVHYALFDPAMLANDKIWAKLAIVWALTANGILLHHVVMPRMRAQVGRSLFEGLDRPTRALFILSGAISVASWYMPVMLGAFSQLNFTVGAGTILLTYGMFVLTMAAAMFAVLKLGAKWPRRPRDASRSMLAAE